MSFIMPIMVILGGSLINSNIIFWDHLSKWENFGYASPVSENRYIKARFLLKSVALLIDMAFVFIYLAVLLRLYDKQVSKSFVGIIFLLVIVAIAIGVSSELTALKYRTMSRAQFEGAIKLICVFVIIALAAVFAFYYKGTHPQMNTKEIIDLLFSYSIKLCGAVNKLIQYTVYFMPIVIIAEFVSGYFIEVRSMKRRER